LVGIWNRSEHGEESNPCSYQELDPSHQSLSQSYTDRPLNTTSWLDRIDALRLKLPQPTRLAHWLALSTAFLPINGFSMVFRRLEKRTGFHVIHTCDHLEV
jgi:hypothetical protein